MRTDLRAFMNNNRNLVQLIIITLLIFILMSVLKPGKFLSYYNFDSISFSFPELGLLSIAMMVAMLTGGIDLSVVAVANLAAVLAGKLFAVLIAGQDLSVGGQLMYVGLGLGVSILVGLVAGMINGFLITGLGITPILCTMGTGQLFTGISLVVTGGPAIVGFPALWSAIGNERIFGLAVPFVIFVVIAGATAFILSKTPFGVRLMLIGANPKAALFSGIQKGRVIFYSYVFTGFLASITGIIMSGRTNAAKSDYGSSYVLQAVLIAVLGGTNPGGGFGTVLGVTIAVIALMFLSSGFQFMRFSNFLVDFIWGSFLLVIMVVNYYNNKRASKRGKK